MNKICQSRQTHVVTTHTNHFIQRTNSHPAPEAGDSQQVVEGCFKIAMTGDLLETPRPMGRQTSPPSHFRVPIPISLIFSDLTIDVAIRRRLLVRMLLDQGLLELVVDICKGLSATATSLIQQHHTCEVNIHRPPSLLRR
jgi:hypothetical protein